MSVNPGAGVRGDSHTMRLRGPQSREKLLSDPFRISDNYVCASRWLSKPVRTALGRFASRESRCKGNFLEAIARELRCTAPGTDCHRTSLPKYRCPEAVL